MSEVPPPGAVVLPLAAESGRAWLASRAPRARTLLYKHSPVCGSSRRAAREVEAWARSHPEVSVLQLDVIHQRALSQELARLLGVEHESPQAILLEGSEVRWHGSHGRVSAAELDEATGTPPAGS